MKKLLFLAALASLASVGTSQKTAFSGPNLQQVTGGTPTGVVVPATILDTRGAEAGTEVDIDLSGVEHWDPELDPDNTILSVAVPAGAMMNGVGWDTIYTSVGASWGSEATMGFSGDAGFNEVYLTPSSTDGVVAMEPSSSGGVIKLADVGIADIDASGGNIDIEFFDTFDDNADAADGFYEAGSVLTIQYAGGGPAVPTVTQWGLIVTTVLLFAGVVFVSMRRKSATNVG